MAQDRIDVPRVAIPPENLDGFRHSCIVACHIQVKTFLVFRSHANFPFYLVGGPRSIKISIELMLYHTMIIRHGVRVCYFPLVRNLDFGMIKLGLALGKFRQMVYSWTTFI